MGSLVSVLTLESKLKHMVVIALFIFIYLIFRMNICSWGDGKGHCFGDWGGPLIFEENGRYTLIGVTSWGIRCNKDFPDVYSRVSARLAWILANTQGTQDTSCATTTTTDNPQASTTAITAMTTASSTTTTDITIASTEEMTTGSTTTGATTTSNTGTTLNTTTTSLTSGSQNLRCRNSRNLGKEMQIVLNNIYFKLNIFSDLQCPARDTMCIATDNTNLIKSVTTMDDVECGCKYKTSSYKKYFYTNYIFQCYATNTFSALSQ